MARWTIAGILLLATLVYPDDGRTLSFNGTVINAGYDRKVSLALTYRGEYWIRFKDYYNKFLLHFNITPSKLVTIQPFGLQWAMDRSFDDYTGGKGYSYYSLRWRPGVFVHVPIHKFLVGGNGYFESHFNILYKDDAGTTDTPSDVYTPYFGILAFGAMDLGVISPFITYNFDIHIDNNENIRIPRVCDKHLLNAGVNFHLLNSLLLACADIKLRIFPDATYHKVETIIGVTLGLNLH
jgi:hypothetical protein